MSSTSQAPSFSSPAIPLDENEVKRDSIFAKKRYTLTMPSLNAIRFGGSMASKDPLDLDVKVLDKGKQKKSSKIKSIELVRSISKAGMLRPKRIPTVYRSDSRLYIDPFESPSALHAHFKDNHGESRHMPSLPEGTEDITRLSGNLSQASDETSDDVEFISIERPALSRHNTWSPRDHRTIQGRSWATLRDGLGSLRRSHDSARPQIRVLIPGKAQDNSAPDIVDDRAEGLRNILSPSISPPSSNTPPNQRGEGPMRMSVVSPMTALDMPRPKRPFLRLSIPVTSEEGEFFQDMQTALASKYIPPARSEGESSGDEVSRPSSRPNSRSNSRPSHSTVSPVEPILPREIPLRFNQQTQSRFSIVSPSDAGFDDLHQIIPLPQREIKPSETKPLEVRSAISVSTAQSKPLMSLNKPLPPVPVDSDEDEDDEEEDDEEEEAQIASLTAPQNGQKITLDIPSPLSFNLQNKPSLNQLEALDNDFRRSASPMRPRTAPEASDEQKGPSPTMDQAAAALDKHLSSLVTSPASSKLTSPRSMSIRDRLDLESPLQISRGSGDMVPTRAAPPPPIVVSPAESNRSSKLQKRRSGFQSMITPKENSPSMERKHPSFQSFRAFVSRSSNSRSSKSYHSSSSNVSEIDSKPKSARSLDTPSSTEAVERRDMAQDPEIAELSAGEIEHNVSRIPEEAEVAEEKPVRKESSARSSVESTRSLFSSTGTDETAGTAPSPEPAQAEVAEAVELEAHPMKAVAILDIVDTYAKSHGADRASSSKQGKAKLVGHQIPEMLDKPEFVSAHAAESIILRIMENIGSLSDLFNTATISKGFYRIFKRHEMHLIKNSLFNMSPAAWELREVSPPWSIGTLDDNDEPCPEYTPSLYLRHYSRDMYTMVALKSLILVHCESFLRVETITGLAGIDERRAAEIDEAFWRVWTFCRIFGCEKNREDDLVGQTDWLNGGVLARQQGTNTSSTIIESFDTNSALFDPVPGFGVGNGEGLSTAQLYDVIEIWTCLGVLVQGFHGKLDEAREAGVFENLPESQLKVEDYEALMLEEWTYYILTLGPSVILRLSSVSPAGPTYDTFEFAKNAGWTTWTPPLFGTSRRTFLKEAISRVYERKLAEEAGQPMTPTRASTKSHKKAKPMSESRKRQIALAQELRAQQRQGQRSKSSDFVPTLSRGPKTYADERPMSHFPDVIESLSSGKRHKRQTTHSSLPTPSPPPPPAIPEQFRMLQSAIPDSQSVHLPEPVPEPVQKSILEPEPEPAQEPEPEPEMEQARELESEPEPISEPEPEMEHHEAPRYARDPQSEAVVESESRATTPTQNEVDSEARSSAGSPIRNDISDMVGDLASHPVRSATIRASPTQANPVTWRPGYSPRSPGGVHPAFAASQQPIPVQSPDSARSPRDARSPPSANAPYISIATFSTPQACVPAPPPGPQVIDPVDRAMRRMVDELGFSRDDAKWALRVCETGERVDVDKAVQMLMKRRPSTSNPQSSDSERPPTSGLGLGITSEGSEVPARSSFEISRVPRAHFAARKPQHSESSAYAAQKVRTGSVQFDGAPAEEIPAPLTGRKHSQRDGWKVWKSKSRLLSH
ncbi:MAG: hypothetical protein Q9227_007712 [Pyrenula ochraceoflavens]